MRFDPLLEQFLTDCGYALNGREANSLEWSMRDPRHILTRTEDGFVFSLIERGTAYPPTVTTTSWDFAQRYVIMLTGSTWRSQQRLPTLPEDEKMDEMHGDMNVLGTLLDAELIWSRPDGNVERATRLIMPNAYLLARYLQYPLRDVIATYRSPEGHPIYD